MIMSDSSADHARGGAFLCAPCRAAPASTLRPEQRSATPRPDPTLDEVIIVIADQDLPTLSTQGCRPCESLRHVQRRPLSQLPAQQAITEPDLPEPSLLAHGIFLNG